MPVFKAVIKSLKEYRSMFIVYFMIFAVFGPMQANAQIGKNEKMFSESSLRVTVIDQDDSELSRGLTDYLETNEEVEVLRTVSDRELQNLNDDVNFEQKDYVLLIDQGFEDKLLKGDTKDSIQYIKNGQSASGYLMTEKIDTYLNYLMVYLKSGYDESSAIRNTAEDMKEADESQVSILENPNMEDRMSVLFRCLFHDDDADRFLRQFTYRPEEERYCSQNPRGRNKLPQEIWRTDPGPAYDGSWRHRPSHWLYGT